MRQWRAPGPGLRTAGSGGTIVSRATEERERARGKKLRSVVIESAWPKILGRGT
jgi:hypothetical protein